MEPSKLEIITNRTTPLTTEEIALELVKLHIEKQKLRRCPVYEEETIQDKFISAHKLILELGNKKAT